VTGRRVFRGCITLLLLSFVLAFRASAQELRTGPITFRYWPGDQQFAQTLAERAALTFPALPGTVLDSGAVVFLAPDESRFDSLTGSQAPEWGAGIAIPDQGIIVLPAYPSRRTSTHDLPRVLRHELAHVALQRWLGPARSPRWFSEGYATWTAGQLDDNAGWLLRLAFLTGRAPPLDSIALEWPAQPTDARVAYLLSASAVSWLHENGGDRVMTIFFERWRETHNFDRALFEVYGLTPASFEEHWSKAVRGRYGWLLFLAQSVVIWAITAVLVLVLFAVRRRRDRRKLADLKETEPPDHPEFWAESPVEEGASADDETGPPR
jgi:hypothetical protein